MTDFVRRARRVADALLPLVVLVLFVSIVALQHQVTDRNQQIDHLSEQSTELQESSEATRQAAEDVQAYVVELRTTTPEEQARNDAITAAVQQVPILRDILCSPDAFPEAAGCRS